jgi:hypothetical protein
VRRTANLAGWRTKVQAKKLLNAFEHYDAERQAEVDAHRRVREEFRDALDRAKTGAGPPPQKPENYDTYPIPRTNAAQEQALAAIAEFSDWLAKKVR